MKFCQIVSFESNFLDQSLHLSLAFIFQFKMHWIDMRKKGATVFILWNILEYCKINLAPSFTLTKNSRDSPSWEPADLNETRSKLISSSKHIKHLTPPLLKGVYCDYMYVANYADEPIVPFSDFFGTAIGYFPRAEAGAAPWTPATEEIGCRKWPDVWNFLPLKQSYFQKHTWWPLPLPLVDFSKVLCLIQC